MRRSLLLLVVLCLALIASACVAAQESPEAGPVASPSSTGNGSGGRDTQKAALPEDPAPADPAPDFEVTTFDGDTFSLAEQRGTPVVLNFWESW